MEWGIAFVVVCTVLALLAWRFDGKRESTHGSAAWSKVWPLFKARLFKRRGLRLGDWVGRLSVFYDGIHPITIGPSGSGKGTSVIVPNMVAHDRMLVVDPGGENTAIACRAWRDRGLEFRCINIFGMFGDDPWELPAHGFNPLDSLDVNSPAFAADALVLAEMLTPRSGRENGSSSYFKDAAQTAKRAMLIHIKTSEAPERQTLGTLYAYVNGDARGWEALLSSMKASPVCGGLVAQEATKLERIEAQASEEFSAIMSTIQQDLSWLADPLVREGMSRSDVDFRLLKDSAGCVISVVLPLQYIETHAAITRLAMACAVLEMERPPLAKGKVLFLIDEAASLGKIQRFPNWLATLRKYRVVIWSIWQNIGQLVELYDRNWQTLIGNCGLIQILGAGDAQTAEYTQKILGQCTVKTVSVNGRGERSISQAGRPLLFPDELMRLPKTKQINFIGNHMPVRLNNTPYWHRPELRGLYHPNPYWDGKISKPSPIDRAKALAGRGYLALVWWMAPHPIAACIISAPFFYLGWQIIKGAL